MPSFIKGMSPTIEVMKKFEAKPDFSIECMKNIFCDFLYELVKQTIRKDYTN